MFNCHCGKSFKTQRSLNSHQISHKERENRYSVSRRKNQTVHNCLQCNIEMKHNNNSTNKFCSLACSSKYKWEQVTIPLVECGLGGIKSSKRYLKEKIGDVCSKCGQLPVWNNEPLVLQLDHIDGNSDNNLPINLRLLCPNCHTQTETFGSKGSGSKIKKITKRNEYLRKYQSSEIIGKRGS